MIPANNKEHKDEKENKLKLGKKECWNCKSSLTNDEWCECCKAPIKKNVISEVINRIKPTEQIKCWRCKGTTSGDICGICGSPLTKIGIDIVKNSTKERIAEGYIEKKLFSIYSPMDKNLLELNVDIFEIESICKKFFTVINLNQTNAGLEIITLMPKDLKKFDEFEKEDLLVNNNIRVWFKKEKIKDSKEKYAKLTFFYWEPKEISYKLSTKKIPWKLILLFTSLVSIFLTGWLYYREVYRYLSLTENILIDIILFSIAIILIIFTHEFAHFLIQRKKKIKLSQPYFIPLPSIPGLLSLFMLGTAGGFLRVVNPIQKKNDLFDLFFIGPITGIVISIGFYLIGSAFPYIQDKSILPVEIVEEITEKIKFEPYLFLKQFLDWFVRATHISPAFNPETQISFMHPLAYAGLVGLILNGLNYLPGVILDGGYMLRCLLSEKITQIFSFLSALFILLNYNTWPLGVLVLFIPLTTYHTAITNDLVKLHWSKYIFEVFAIFLAIICLPIQVFFFFQW